MERLRFSWLGRIGSDWRGLGGYGRVHSWVYVRLGVFAHEITCPEVAFPQ